MPCRFHLDLFSGIGGFAIAAQACGYTTIGFCEREPYAQQVLKERFGAVLADARRDGLGEIKHQSSSQVCNEKRNPDESASGCWNSPLLHPDIFTLNGADYAGVDLITGGFPCQPFSVAGKRKGAADDRALWPEMLRVIRQAQPAWIIGENVAGIVTMELDNILSDLEGIGYSAWPLVIPACAVGAFHRRDRVFIIGRRILHPDTGHNERTQSKREHERPEVSGGSGANGVAAGEDVAHATRELQHRCGESRDWRGQSANGGEDVAHADSSGQRQGNEEAANRTPEQPHGGCFQQSNVSNPGGTGLQGQLHAGSNDTERWQVSDGRPTSSGGVSCGWKPESQWFAESGMGRVAYGIPNRAHRLRGLGNAIVPQVVIEIIRAITSSQED